MQDRPTAIELLEAAANFVEREIVTATSGPRQFQSRVVANVMRIVARELDLEEPQLNREGRELSALLGHPPPQARGVGEMRRAVTTLNQELSDRIRSGQADAGPWRERVMGFVRESVENKLRIANPRYLEKDIAARARTSAQPHKGARNHE